MPSVVGGHFFLGSYSGKVERDYVCFKEKDQCHSRWKKRRPHFNIRMIKSIGRKLDAFFSKERGEN